MAAKTLPSTGAVTGIKETLDFFGDPQFAQKRFTARGDVFETRLLNQRLVFIRGEQTIADLFAQEDALEGWCRRAFANFSATAPWPIAAGTVIKRAAAWSASCFPQQL